MLTNVNVYFFRKNGKTFLTFRNIFFERLLRVWYMINVTARERLNTVTDYGSPVVM